MSKSALLCLLAVATTACSDFELAGELQGTIDGVVSLTAPVGGVIVTAYPYDLQSGAQGAELAHSEPTTPGGEFHLDLGIYFGSVMLVARGAGATYTEPATTQQIDWDAAQSLHAPFVAWLPNGDLRLEFQRGEKQAGLVVGPWSELAYALTPAKQAAGSDGAFSSALKHALLLLHDHLEVDFWSTAPVDLTSGDTRAWQAPVQVGLENAGFSQLVSRMATASSTGGLSAVDLLRALVRDAKDGLFDGRGSDGALTLGTCKKECQLSSQTLRSDFADSMALFLASETNKSTLEANAVNDFLLRVAKRHSDLFPDDGMDTYDVTPPTISVVESTVVDQTSGDVTVPLNGSTTATFGRYAVDYGPDAAGIPRWRFLVQDDRSADAQLDVQARLVRIDDSAELVPWFAVPLVGGAGYDREIVVSSALHPDIATKSGGYQLEVTAKDEKGNVSAVTTVAWQQTILAPPLPTVFVVDNSAIDEAPLTVSVTDIGPVYAGTPGVVTLSATSTPSFSRYASHFGPADSGIPKWHFLAAQGTKDVDVQARLLRVSDMAVLVPWFAVPPVVGSGYNREIVISSALHPDVATLSDTYQLEVIATDSGGNVSPPAIAKWQQTVLAPPVRQRAAAACDPASDGQCPAHYSLQGNLDAAVPINGIGLPGGALRIGHFYIDNPNPVAVRVTIAASASLTWSRGRRNWINPIVNPVPFTPGCSPNQDLAGNCYGFTTPKIEDLAVNQTIGSVSTGLQVLINGSDPGACSLCGAWERELPAGTTADVWVTTAPYTFLWPAYALGRLTNVNMPATAIGSEAEIWVHWVTSTFKGFAQTWWYLTRLSISPTVLSSLQSRPAAVRAARAVAIGTNTLSFTATPSLWRTSAPGEGSF